MIVKGYKIKKKQFSREFCSVIFEQTYFLSFLLPLATVSQNKGHFGKEEQKFPGNVISPCGFVRMASVWHYTGARGHTCSLQQRWGPERLISHHRGGGLKDVSSISLYHHSHAVCRPQTPCCVFDSRQKKKTTWNINQEVNKIMGYLIIEKYIT